MLTFIWLRRDETAGESLTRGGCREELMNKPTKVLFIGLDAADKDLVLQWCDEGVLPTFASLRENGSWATTRIPHRI